MTDEKIYDLASDVTADDGAVAVKGPDDVDVKFTPEAAEETSNRMLEGSMKARGQRYFNRHRK
ncbi:MAG TPA: hypothetical protein VM760_06200 [Sphingomicrobium sp.]|jgi:hypothetical protein|nr:hypothetical protein [Sphingomicrobium sp.]